MRTDFQIHIMKSFASSEMDLFDWIVIGLSPDRSDESSEVLIEHGERLGE